MRKFTRNQKIAIYAIIVPAILVVLTWFVVKPKENSQTIVVNGDKSAVSQNLQKVDVGGNENIVNIFIQGVEGNIRGAEKAIENDSTIKPSEKESLLLFLQEMDNIPDESRKKFIENYLKAPEEFQNALQQVTLSAQSVEKASLIGKVFRKYIIGDLTFEEACKLSYMVNYAFYGDLQKFFLNKNLKIEDTNQSLVTAGVFRVSVSGGGYRARYNPSTIEYIITDYGNKLFEIANETDQ